MKKLIASYWKKLNQVQELDLWHLFMIYLALTDETVAYHFKYVICISAVVGLTLDDKLWQRFTLSIYALTLSLCLFLYFYTAANHFFVITYFAAFLSLMQWNLLKEARYGYGLVVMIMSLATLQKILSPPFVEGSFAGFLFLSGSSLQALNEWNFSGFGADIAFFNEQISSLTSNRVGNQTLKVNIPAHFMAWSLAFTLIIALVELALVGILIWNKGSFRYWAMLLFLWGTVFFRKEYTFFATLSFLLVTDKQMEDQRLSNLFKLSFILFLLFSFFGVLE